MYVDIVVEGKRGSESGDTEKYGSWHAEKFIYAEVEQGGDKRKEMKS